MTDVSAPAAMVPVPYYPAATQSVLAANARRIRGTPYEEFFRDEMFLPDDVLPALRRPMDPADALDSGPEALNTLLDPGDHRVENGYCLLPGGTAYVASRTRFPGATGEMFSWFFWWYMAASERYSVWSPYTRVTARALDTAVLTRPGLTHEQRYVGNTVHVTEYVGPKRITARTRFVEPSAWGLDTGRFTEAKIVAQVCGEIILAGVRVGRMLRLARATDDGFELRTRFWLGERIAAGPVNLTPALSALGLKRRLITPDTGYEQLFNDQMGMTHLAGLLPGLHATFGTPSA
ncbi:hypothetical protein AB0F77_28445 [Streptomyces sp. NPDC026672]|uniref:DAPG hydrolase family protein n=1 Tax=unclassified Streptomyces TaxID=2593676 RepID=UPI0033E8BD58